MNLLGGCRPGGRSGTVSMAQARNPCLGFSPGRNESSGEAHLGRVISDGPDTGWLSSGSNGKEKPEEEQGHKEDKIVKGLVKKLNQKDGQEKVKPGGDIHPYMDDGLDLPGLEVPDREE